MPQGRAYTFDDKMMTIVAMARQLQPGPTVDQVRRAIGAASTNTAHRRIHWLIDEGYLIKGGGKRTLMATQKGLNIFPEFFIEIDGQIPTKDVLRADDSGVQPCASEGDRGEPE